MSSVHFNLITAYIMSFLGTVIDQSHMMLTLLCLEGMTLSTFIFGALMMHNSPYLLFFTIPIIMLVFTTCEAAVGLALLVMISNTYWVDYVQNLNLL